MPFPSSDGLHTPQVSEPFSSNQNCWAASPTSPCYDPSCWSLPLLPSHVPVFSDPVTGPLFWSLSSLHYTTHSSLPSSLPQPTHSPAHPSFQMCNIGLIACSWDVCLFLSVQRRVKYSLWHRERVWVLQQQWDLTLYPIVSPSFLRAPLKLSLGCFLTWWALMQNLGHTQRGYFPPSSLPPQKKEQKEEGWRARS